MTTASDETRLINLELLIAYDIILSLDIIRELSVDEVYILCNGDHPKTLGKEIFRGVFSSLLTIGYIYSSNINERGKHLYSLTEKGYGLLEKPQDYPMN